MGDGAMGSHSLFGEIVHVRTGHPVLHDLIGAVVVDDVTPDLVPFLPGAAGVVAASTGPWERAIPGTLTDNLRRSGVGALLDALDVPVVWGVAGASALVDGDLAQVDPAHRTVWALSV